MRKIQQCEAGFTLIEIAIVVLIVSILLGYTVALFPKQQELKQYRAADQEMDEIIAAIIGFAQINGRLPCPAITDSAGVEDGGGTVNCDNYGGFVPVNTLGLAGKINADRLLLDPWGNPYRYYVSDSDFTGGSGVVGDHDFVQAAEMKAVGLLDLDVDGYIDLDGQYLICPAQSAPKDDECSPGGAVDEVFGNPAGAGGPYAGAPFVLLSLGKNANDGAAVGDELENMGDRLSTTHLGWTPGPTGNEYFLKNLAVGETTFVKRPTGFADDFDDIIKWVSPNILFSKMIEAGQLP